MLEFKKVDLSDMKIIRSYLGKSPYRSCDYTPCAVMMWRNVYHLAYAVYEDTLILKYVDPDNPGTDLFSIPIGKKVADAIGMLREYCRGTHEEFRIDAVPEEGVAFLKERYPDIIAETNRDWSDYLYHAEDIVTFAGRRYAGQRNHINKFRKLYPDYRFEAINEDNVGRVADFFAWYRTVYTKDKEFAEDEANSIEELLKHYSEFGVFGGFIEVNGEIAAMSVGEIIGDTLYVHVEKGDLRYPGIYQVIVNEFAKAFAGAHVLYINREDDMGDEGLRTSKLSYHPCRLLEKFAVTIPDSSMN